MTVDGDPVIEGVVLGDQALVGGAMFTQTADVTRNNSTSELSLVGAGKGTVTLPANALVVGRTIRVIACGYYGSKNAAAGTLTIRLDVGGTDVYSHAHTLDNNLGNDEYWECNTITTCRSVGGSGTIMSQGNWEHSSDNPATDEWHAGATINNSTDTIDTTGTLAIDLTAQFSAADTDNTITCTNLIIEVLN